MPRQSTAYLFLAVLVAGSTGGDGRARASPAQVEESSNANHAEKNEDLDDMVVIEADETPLFKPKPELYSVKLDFSDLFTGLFQVPGGQKVQQNFPNLGIPGLENLIPPGLGEASKTPAGVPAEKVSGAQGRPVGPLRPAIPPLNVAQKVNFVPFRSNSGPWNVSYIDICYYIGADLEKSHVPWNDRWNHRPNYFHELTELAQQHLNQFMGNSEDHIQHMFVLNNKGAYNRTDFQSPFPEKVQEDTKRLYGSSCDIVVFLVFNDFTSGDWLEGVKYSGLQQGGPCMSNRGDGFVVVVDQGFTVSNPKDFWIGPQILSHFLLRTLLDDVHNPEPGKYPWTDPSYGYFPWNTHPKGLDFRCKNERSLLHEFILAGSQGREKCTDAKLSFSHIACKAPCLEIYQYYNFNDGPSYIQGCEDRRFRGGYNTRDI